MKTWEVMRELEINPHKKFRLKGEDNEVILEVDEHGDISLTDIDWFGKNDEWEEIEVSFDFMTAINMGMKFKVEHKLIPIKLAEIFSEYLPLSNILNTLSKEILDCELLAIIKEGKWFVK